MKAEASSAPGTFCATATTWPGCRPSGPASSTGRRPAPGYCFPTSDAVWPQVGLLTLGDDGRQWRELADGYGGLVVAAFGAGHVPEAAVPVLADLAQQLPVVLASRTGGGPVLANTYGFTGSESDMLARGLIRAGFLDPYQARILLTVLLTATRDRDTILEAFAAAGGYADPDTRPWPCEPSLTATSAAGKDHGARS